MTESTDHLTAPAIEAQIPVKCLIVDDREENLLVLAELLKGDGVEIFKARSGPEALDLLLGHEFALALLDVQMPEMDGFELATVMRGSERTRRIPIIFVTAGARDQARVFRGYDAGAVDFLYKPIEPHILRNKAEVFFQLSRQRVQLARDLQERTETLRLHEMFTAVLSHDLRNPLNVIAIGAQMLDRPDSDAHVRRTAVRMKASAQRMGRLIDDLLDSARVRLGRGIPLRLGPADLAPLVHRAVQEQEAGTSDTRVETTLTGDLGGYWDTDRLAQVLSNLLANAMTHGAGSAQVIADGSDPRSVSLTVTNQGAIPPERLPHVFNPFSGGGEGRRSDGLGLGLYIVEQIVRAHGGTVHVSSTVDTTSFTVMLPRVPVTPDDDTRRSHPAV
jgi:signal transduction histidine kinase